MTHHTYKIYNGENNIGCFKGKTPKQVANKAFSSIVRSLKDEYNVGTIIPFTIQECTRTSEKKIYNYNGTRTQLDYPRVVRIGNKYVTHKYKNNIKKAKDISIAIKIYDHTKKTFIYKNNTIENIINPENSFLKNINGLFIKDKGYCYNIYQIEENIVKGWIFNSIEAKKTLLYSIIKN